MATFISLMSWTDQGVRTFEGTVERYRATAELAKRLGGELKQVYWTIGPYDIVSIAEFPDDEAGAAFLLALGAKGNLHTTTLRGYPPDQMQEIIGRA
ncbi:MAG TPA: GYD domain-containing protein, partial [Micromonosporaceae bacterium]